MQHALQMGSAHSSGLALDGWTRTHAMYRLFPFPLSLSLSFCLLIQRATLYTRRLHESTEGRLPSALHSKHSKLQAYTNHTDTNTYIHPYIHTYMRLIPRSFRAVQALHKCTKGTHMHPSIHECTKTLHYASMLSHTYTHKQHLILPSPDSLPARRPSQTVSPCASIAPLCVLEHLLTLQPKHL